MKHYILYILFLFSVSLFLEPTSGNWRIVSPQQNSFLNENNTQECVGAVANHNGSPVVAGSTVNITMEILSIQKGGKTEAYIYYTQNGTQFSYLVGIGPFIDPSQATPFNIEIAVTFPENTPYETTIQLKFFEENEVYYQCLRFGVACPPGFVRELGICTDFNECEHNTTICTDFCVNTQGGFYCSVCPLGFEFSNGVCKVSCGDGVCNSTIGENCVSCPKDCNESSCNTCGDGVCDANENCTNCYLDCSSSCTPPETCSINNGGCDFKVKCIILDNKVVCGDCPLGTVGSGNTSCQTLCGDLMCNATIGENCVTCPQDCTSTPCNVCGDGSCEAEENCVNCYSDCKNSCERHCEINGGGCDIRVTCTMVNNTVVCGDCPKGFTGQGNTTCIPLCGDGVCDELIEEDCMSCPMDCGSDCDFCGDGRCSRSENCRSCFVDCGSCDTPDPCGDGFCSSEETCSSCPEDCPTCTSTTTGIVVIVNETTTTTTGDFNSTDDEQTSSANKVTLYLFVCVAIVSFVLLN